MHSVAINYVAAEIDRRDGMSGNAGHAESLIRILQTGMAHNQMKKALNTQGFFHLIAAAETDRPAAIRLRS